MLLLVGTVPICLLSFVVLCAMRRVSLSNTFARFLCAGMSCLVISKTRSLGPAAEPVVEARQSLTGRHVGRQIMRYYDLADNLLGYVL